MIQILPPDPCDAGGGASGVHLPRRVSLAKMNPWQSTMTTSTSQQLSFIIPDKAPADRDVNNDLWRTTTASSSPSSSPSYGKSTEVKGVPQVQQGSSLKELPKEITSVRMHFDQFFRIQYSAENMCIFVKIWLPNFFALYMDFVFVQTLYRQHVSSESVFSVFFYFIKWFLYSFHEWLVYSRNKVMMLVIQIVYLYILYVPLSGIPWKLNL